MKKTFEKLLKDSKTKLAKKTFFVILASGSRKLSEIVKFDKIDPKTLRIFKNIVKLDKCMSKGDCKDVVSGQCKHKVSKNGNVQLDVKLKKFLPGFHYITWSGTRLKH